MGQLAGSEAMRQNADAADLAAIAEWVGGSCRLPLGLDWVWEGCVTKIEVLGRG